MDKPDDKPDIETAADIDRLMAGFYRQRALPDPIIGFYFDALNLDRHLPRISAFWQKQLLGIPGYTGRSFETHLLIHRHTAITGHHFHRWLYLFNQTVDALFAGPRAELAKQRAAAIAHSMETGLANPERVGPLERALIDGVRIIDPGAQRSDNG